MIANELFLRQPSNSLVPKIICLSSMPILIIELFHFDIDSRIIISMEILNNNKVVYSTNGPDC
ncbi:hypothetical protein LFU01_41770 [Lysinibacillus fusiformis]|nr:hypothetical protein LFU01_41770 [Lysinibacillus fusiformis]